MLGSCLGQKDIPLTPPSPIQPVNQPPTPKHIEAPFFQASPSIVSTKKYTDVLKRKNVLVVATE